MKTLYQGSGYGVYLVQTFDWLAEALSSGGYSSAFVLVDENTGSSCWPLLKPFLTHPYLHLIEIPSGEVNKNLSTCAVIWEKMLDKKADRHSVLLNLGGGVIGDMGGFCASTYMRGIDFIQIPTSLLAQVDASVGGKVGIDFGGIKNSIGLFRNPVSVWIYPPFLKTLPPEELRSGFAEVIKHTLIGAPAAWRRMQELNTLDHLDWHEIISSNIPIKGKVVDEDPYESGSRKVLNFGHTVGHALESLSLETSRPLRHGEAIAAGMVMESHLSWQQGGLSFSEVEKISSFIFRIFGQYDFHSLSFERLIGTMQKDKKNRDGLIQFCLLESVGKPIIDISCSREQIGAALAYYHNYLPL